MTLSQTEKDDLEFKLGQFFRPTLPINREDLFSGRMEITQEVISAINQQGQHVILYGERGVGKTSLANMIMLRAKPKHPSAAVLAPHVNCMGKNDYNAIWMAVLDDIAYRAEKQELELPKAVRKLIHDFENGIKIDFTPEIARRIVVDLSDANMVIVIILDEVDTIEDDETRRSLAETVKFFSDRNIPGTIVLIGVADDVSSLIREHQSIERCLAQIRMPRMSRDEIESIVTNSLEKVGMTIDRSALHEISRIAIGLPHYAHTLGLYAGRASLAHASKNISQPDVSAAARIATAKAQVTIHNAYSKATLSSKKNALYKQVLLACALAGADEYGYFSPADVRDPLKRILKREYKIEAFARHLHTFCEDDRGPVLRKADLVNRPRFRFENPLMQPFVLMKGLDDEMITDNDLRETRDTNDPQGRLF